MVSGIGWEGVEGGGWGELQLRKMSDGLAHAFIHRAISTSPSCSEEACLLECSREDTNVR